MVSLRGAKRRGNLHRPVTTFRSAYGIRQRAGMFLRRFYIVVSLRGAKRRGNLLRIPYALGPLCEGAVCLQKQTGGVSYRKNDIPVAVPDIFVGDKRLCHLFVRLWYPKFLVRYMLTKF